MKFLFIIVFKLILVTVVVIAQQLSSSEKARFDYAHREINALYLDTALNELRRREDKEEVLFAIARLGDGESDASLNQRRLHNVRAYLRERGLSAERIGTASGERIDKEGCVELYVAGKLVSKLSISKGRDVCVDCCDFPDEKYYPFKKDTVR